MNSTRVLVIHMLNNDTKFKKWDENHYAIADNLIIIFTTLVPIVSQTVTLIFGLKRHSQDKTMGKMNS